MTQFSVKRLNRVVLWVAAGRHDTKHSCFYECDGETLFRGTITVSNQGHIGANATTWALSVTCWYGSYHMWRTAGISSCGVNLGKPCCLCIRNPDLRTGYRTERYFYSSVLSNCHTRSCQDPRFSESGAKRATFSCPPGTPLLLPSVQNYPNHKLSSTETMETRTAERVTVHRDGKGHLLRTLASLSQEPRIGLERICYT